MKIVLSIILMLSVTQVSFAKRRVVVSKEELQAIENRQKKSQSKVNKIPEAENKESQAVSSAPSKKKSSKKSGKIYTPAPVVDDAKLKGYLMERDSHKIITKKMSQMDTLNINMCVSSGVSISLDESFNETLQTSIIDDRVFFEAKEFQNKKGVYVRLTQPIPEGRHMEAALRLVTASNDKTFLVNLIGLPCPKVGGNPFPKVYYIKEKYGLLNMNSDILPPEDTIIRASEGYARKNLYGIRIYDMVASSNSDWIVFGVEVQYQNQLSDKTQIVMKVLDNLQVSMMPSNFELLPLHSKKATAHYEVPTLRFRLAVNVGKKYILDSQYLHLMVLDKETQHYQYKRIDLLPYFDSLRKRGFNL